MNLLDKEKKRLEKLKTESEFIDRLWHIAYPCNSSKSDTSSFSVSINTPE